MKYKLLSAVTILLIALPALSQLWWAPSVVSTTALPASCTPGGPLYQLVSGGPPATAGTVYYCSATNTFTAVSGGGGTVTSASVVSANGFAGTVTTPTTTPAITLTTTITGLLKGNGTAVSAASAGTDYAVPSGALGTPTSGVMTNVTGIAANLTAGFASASDHAIASCGANTWANGATTAWVLNCVQPAFSNISGNFTLAQFPSLGANTALVNATAGSAVPTAFAMPSCSGAGSALKWTTSTGFGCNSSITAATNANLTGPITSSGNATAIAAQTGTGSTFAMSVGPTFTGTTTTDLLRATDNTAGVHVADFTQQNASGYGVDIIPGADTGVFALQIVNAANITVRDAFFGNGDVQLSQGGGTTAIGGAATVGGTLGITGHVTVEGVTSTGATGTGKFVFDTAPTFPTTVAVTGALTPSQTAGVVGTTTNNNANAGSFGEYQTGTVATNTTSLSTGTTANVGANTNITLTAGDWDCAGAVNFTFGATTSITNLTGGISTTTATLPAQDSYFDYETSAIVPTGSAVATWVVPVVRLSLSGSTNVFLVSQATFTASTLKVGGTIRCRRMR